MSSNLRLGYLVFEVRDFSAWDTFCRNVLGLQAPHWNGKGRCGWQVDESTQRIVTEEGPSNDLQAIGLECTDDAALDRALNRLTLNGVEFEEALSSLRLERRVKRLYLSSDPAGNVIELFTQPEQSPRPFSSEAFPAGFRTGASGLGHVVLVARDLKAMETFYVDVLGFAVTERLATRVGPIDFRGTFLHCNERHHSLALFDLPLKRRIHHFMLEAEDLSDVGRAFERTVRAKVPVSLGLGQHPDPDGTFSFYAATPSGFDFEIGSASHLIEPKAWQTQITHTTSSWGHKPTLRLQLKMGMELVIDKLFRKRGKKLNVTP